MPVGVESAHSFGDMLFNIPLIRAIHEKYGEVWVAVRPWCADAFENIPWISKIVHIPDIYHGLRVLKEMGCDPVYQITQNAIFPEFKQSDPNHSLLDTPLLTGRQLGIQDFNQKPIINLTEQEILTGKKIIETSNQPTICIEDHHKSGQSWSDKESINEICNKYVNTHRILWLSASESPNNPSIIKLHQLGYTRRQAIATLYGCETFFSVGSGFFCASLALPEELQPKKIVCLWHDDYYKYEEPLKTRHKWHKEIIWLHNKSELKNYLTNQ